MPRRLIASFFALMAALLTVSSVAWAAPHARILRIDPRAAMSDGAPVLTVVVDLVQRDDSAVRYIRFPARNAHLLVTVDGGDQPATFVSDRSWGRSLKQPGVGTAWLILVDAAGTMGGRRDEAKNIASSFIRSMGPNDIVNIMAFDGRSIVQKSKWLSARQKNTAVSFVQGIPSYGRWGRARPLATIIKSGVEKGFETLGNAGSKVKIPLHQALVVLSDGSAGADPLANSAGALQLQKHFTNGRFGDNTAMPKTPLPVISILFPRTQVEEFAQNSREFMQNIANPDIGGYFATVNGGVPSAGSIVGAVHGRFNHMHILKYRVSCIAPKVQQTFKLVFGNVNPPIISDASFKDVPIGIDPSTWPLDINMDYTLRIAKKHRVHPGGTFKVFGNFCWGGDKSRAEVYFLPKNQPAPPTVKGGDIATAKRAQQQLIAMNMKGKAVETADTYVEFEAPDDERILSKEGGKLIARMVIYDNKAHRASAADAAHIVKIPAESKPFPFLLVGGGIFGLLVVMLLIVAIIRGGSGGKRRGRSGGAPPPAPIVAGGGPQAVSYGAPQAQPYGGAPQAQPYGGAPQAQSYAAPAAPAAPVAPAAPAQAPGGDFMYGGAKPGNYALTGAQPQHPEPPPNPYGGPAGGGAQAVLSGQVGNYPIPHGGQLAVGRDASRCQVVLQEPRVSGVHAILTFDGNQVMVRDQGSNNGTTVNGNRLQPGAPTPVPQGSVIRFGPVEFVLRLT